MRRSPSTRGVPGVVAYQPSTGGTVSRWEFRSRQGRSLSASRRRRCGRAAWPRRRASSQISAERSASRTSRRPRRSGWRRTPPALDDSRRADVRPMHAPTTIVPLPRSPKISDSRAFLWLPLTMWTARTPASATRAISSSLATMPPVTAALRASLRASAAVSRDDRLSGSPAFTSTPGDVGEENQLLRRELDGESRRDRVRVDVEDLALLVRGQRRDDRQVPGVEQRGQEARVHVHDVPHVAEVHGLALSRLAVDHPLLRSAAGEHDVAVDAGDTDGVHAVRAQGRENLDGDLAREDHLDDLERVVVGDAPAVDEPRLQPQPLGELCRLRAASVDRRDADPDLVEERDLLRQRVQVPRVLRHLPRDLDDERPSP